MSIKTTIDKVPVEFEIKSVGPASIEDIDKFREDLSAGKIVVVKKSQEPNPYLRVEEPEVVKPEVIEAVEAIEETETVVKEDVKPWWMSKTIIANVLTAVGCALATFLTDNPDMATYLPMTALATINLVLRRLSKKPITMPFEERLKARAKKNPTNNV